MEIKIDVTNDGEGFVQIIDRSTKITVGQFIELEYFVNVDLKEIEKVINELLKSVEVNLTSRS